jgi:hypothetical protein
MTYAQYGRIQATDYNNFVSTGTPNFNNIWSTGSGNSGYGQSSLSTVSSGDRVTANSWSNFVNFTANVALHQGSSITAVTPPPAGNIIAFISALSTNLTTINTNRLNANLVGTDISNTATRSTSWGTGVALANVTSTVTITFATTAAARYYFNAGGTIRITCSKTGAALPVDTAWINLCADIGAIALPAVSTSQTIASQSYTGLTKIGGGGTAPITYVRNGFYDLTVTPTAYFKQLSNYSVYTGDYIQMTYSVNTVTPNIITVAVLFHDSATFGNNTITGNLSVTAVARQPESTYITSTWGTPTVAVTAPA